VRMLPTRFLSPKPMQIKRQVAALRHVSAPLKGLSLSSKLVPGDPLTAVVLDNWIIEENRITSRPGYSLSLAHPDGQPIESFVPYYGAPNKIAAATNGKVSLLDGTTVHGGFTSNDWSVTSFSNLSAVEYSVMVNGTDGVWSWDGTTMAAETVTAPPAETWINTSQFNVILAHMNRLWFADSDNLAVYYLPVQTKAGQVKVIPLNAVFKRGGHIVALATWTLDGGFGMEDQLVIFSSNGEAVVYRGLDPDTDFQLVGIYRFDSPMSKHSVVNWGGELYCLISTGLVPMSTLMRAETEQLGKTDQNVYSAFLEIANRRRDNAGWQVINNPNGGALICNMPLGGKNTYKQMVRFMPAPKWASWSNLPSRCWGWVNDRLFIGSDDGKVYEIATDKLNDNGVPIKIDVQAAWSNYGTPASKLFKMILPYLESDGVPMPFVDMKVDYDLSPPLNQPDVSNGGGVGASWNTATWDVDGWAAFATQYNNWQGVGVMGRVGAPRFVALVADCTISLNGWDVLYESGSVFG
jgi:hypothetical protein